MVCLCVCVSFGPWNSVKSTKLNAFPHDNKHPDQVHTDITIQCLPPFMSFRLAHSLSLSLSHFKFMLIHFWTDTAKINLMGNLFYSSNYRTKRDCREISETINPWMGKVWCYRCRLVFGLDMVRFAWHWLVLTARQANSIRKPSTVSHSFSLALSLSLHFSLFVIATFVDF